MGTEEDLMSTSRPFMLAVASVSVALVLAACGSDDGGDSADESVAPDTAAQEDVVENDTAAPADAAVGALQVTSVDFETGAAVLTNTGPDDYDLSGHWICNRPSYAELSSEILPPGGTIDVGLSGFSADGGELAVYTSNSFSSADDIVSYVRWGASGGRQSTAEEAGIWTGGTVAPTGTTITLSGDPGSPDGWSG